MEWNNDRSLQLIDLYREKECLWNSKLPEYTNKLRRKDAWQEISSNFECGDAEVKKKMDSLLSSFRRERQKEGKTKGTGTGADMIYSSSWFAYNSMAFLLDKHIPNRTTNTEDLLHGQNGSENGQTEMIVDNCNDEKATDDPGSVDEALSTEGEAAQPGNAKRKKLSRSPKKRSSASASQSSRSSADEAYSILKDAVQRRNVPKDDSAIYGEYIAAKHSASASQSSRSSADEAYSILKDAVQRQNVPKDDSAIYGEYIASKHRKYSSRTRSVIEHLIGDILFNADMGWYDGNTQPHASAHTFPPPRAFSPLSVITSHGPHTTPLSSPSTSLSASHYSQRPQLTHSNLRLQ